jgi:RNA-directed DNA polymerase
MLEVDMTLFSGLCEHLPDAHSMEYADCRLSLLAVQKGVCSISGEKFVTATEIACHLKTPKEYGGLERYSNLVLIHKKYVPLLQIGDAKSLRDICRLLKVTKKQLTKINTLRKAAKLAAI